MYSEDQKVKIRFVVAKDGNAAVKISMNFISVHECHLGFK